MRETSTRRPAPLAVLVATVMVATLLVFDIPSASADPAPAPLPGQIDTFGGNGQAGRGGDGGAAVRGQIGEPSGLAVDDAGNVYVAQAAQHVIRRIDTAGIISTFAGDGTAGYTGDGGRATEARLNFPRGLVVGSDGGLYVADASNNAIRRIDLASGVIDTVVSPSRSLRETTHPQHTTQGYVLRPHGLAFGPDRALYVSGCGGGACGGLGGHWIRRIDLDAGTIGTYAGTGTSGFSGDGGDRMSAQFAEPYGIAFLGSDLLVADRSNRRVRRIDGNTGVVTTAMGTGRAGWSDADGLPAEQADANLPMDVLVDPAGAWYVSNSDTLVRVGPDGVAGTVAGLGPSQGDGGPSVLSQIRGGALGRLPDGRILAAEATFTHRVRAITPGLPPDPPAGVSAEVVDDATLTATVNPAAGLARLHQVRIDPPPVIRRIDEQRSFYSQMPQAVLLDPSMTRSTTFTDIDVEQLETVEARAHNGWGFGPWRTFSLTPSLDPDDPTCRWAIGASGDWHDPTRWSCGGEQRVPTIDDDVVIDVEPGGTSLTVTMASNAAARTLVVGAMDSGRTKKHHLVMTDGISTDPRTLTLGAGSFVVDRSGFVTTGRPTVFGANGQRGWLGRITGPGGMSVDMTVHGEVEAFNMELTGNLTVAWPPGVTEGQPGYVITRGASWATGSIDIVAGGAAFVVVYRGEEPDQTPRPPRFAALGGDLTIAEGGDLRIWHETDSTGAATDGQTAVAVPNGRVINHGSLRVDGRTNVAGRLDWTMTIDGPVDNHGRLVTGVQGVRLGGPAGTVHTNSGEIVIGDRAFTTFTEEGGPLIVNPGASLVSTGSIEIDRTRRLHGSLVNDGGTVRRTTLVSFDETVDLGLDDPQPKVAVTHDGSARPVTITWYGSPHPYAGADGRVDGSDQWWAIDVDPLLGTASLTLPRATDRDDPVMCRHLPGDDANPTVGWDCLDPDEVTATTLTANPQGTLVAPTEWAIGGAPEPEPEPDPVAFELFDVDRTGPDLTNAVLLGLLSSAVYRWACGAATCEPGVGGNPDENNQSNEDWAASIAALADDWRFSDLRTHHDPPTGTPDDTGADAMSLRIDDAMVFVFRGTEGLTEAGRVDWATNSQFQLTEVDLPGLGVVNVHRGFWGALDAIYADMVAHADEHPDVPIWITGHSLGGAMALLAAARLHVDGYEVGGVHTFGAPLVGDAALQSAYAAAGLSERTHRWAADRDLITLLLLVRDEYGDIGRDHLFYRTDPDDELAFTLELDDQLELRPAAISDHDISRYVRRLHSLLPAEVTEALPVPYTPPDPDNLGLDAVIEFAIAVGLDAALIAHLLQEWASEYGEIAIDAAIELLLLAGASIEYVLAVLDELYDATRDVIIAVLLEVLERLGLLVERIVEAFAALAAALQVTLDELLGFLADLGLDEETYDEIVALLTAVVGDLSAALRDLFGMIQERLLAWLAQFGIELENLPPLLPDDLRATFDLDNLWATISAAITGEVNAALDDLAAAGEAGLADFITAMEGLGFVVVHAPVPGAPEPPAGDIVEFLWTIELLPSVTDLLDELGLNTDGLLGGLASSDSFGDMEADLDLDAALTTTVRFGIDQLGPYLAPDTGVVLDIDGSIGVDGTAEALGAPDTAISGSTTVDLGVVVNPSWSGRVRLDDPDLLTLPTVEIALDSTASTTMSLSRDLLDVTWQAAAAYVDGALDLDAAATATLPLPGFTDDDGGPATISLSGERVAGTWVLQGALDQEPVGLGPVTIDALDVGPITIAPGIFTGHGSGSLTVEFGGASESADLEFSFGASGVGIAAGRNLADPFAITIGGVDLARIDNGRIEADVAIEPDGTTDLGVGLTADALVLLPNLGSDGALVITGIDAQVGTDGGLRLDDLGEVALSLPGGVEIVLETVVIDLGGGEDDPVLTAASGTLSVPGLGLTGEVTQLEIGRDGLITVATATGSASPTDALGDLAGFLPFQLTSVEIDFPQTPGQPIRLDEFVLTASGTLDLSLLEGALGADIEVRVGDTVVTEDEFTIQIVVESVSPLVIAPVGVDAVTVEITGLDIGPLTIDATIVFDAAGGTTVVSGSVQVTGPGLDLDGTVTGSVTDGVVTIELDVTAEATPFAGVELDDFTLSLVLTGNSDGLVIGSFAASASVVVELDSATLTIPLTMSFDEGTFELSGGLQLDGELPIDFGDTTVVVLTDPEIDLELVTTGSETTLTIGVAAAGFDVFPDLDALVATGTDVTGSLSTDGTFSLTAATLDGTIADTFTFGVSNAAVTVGPDAPVVFSATSVDGAVPDLGLEIVITDLVILRDGTISVGSITVETGELERTLGIAGLFPFTIADGGVTITFDDPDDPLSAFDVSVTGAFDLSKLDELGESLGFTPVLTIGDRTLGGGSEDDGVFTFAVAVDVNAAIPVRPIDLPPITLGFDDLTVGPLTFGADITFAGFDSGEFVPTISGTARIAGGIEVDGTHDGGGADGSLEVGLTGTMTFDGDVTRLELTAALLVSGSLGEFIVVKDLAVDASMTFSFDASTLALSLSPPTLGDITYALLEIGVTDLVTFTAGDGTIDLGAGAGELLAEFRGGDDDPGLGIRFGDGAGPLADWGGSVRNVGLRMTSIGTVGGVDALVPVPVLLPGFAADLDLPSDLDVGFPDWVPLNIRSIGFTLPDDVALDLDALADDPAAEAVEFATDLFTGLRLRISGGLEATDLIPITADVEGLELSISRLIDCALAAVPPPDGQTAPVCVNPIIDLDGIAGGVEPFDLGPLTIGGVLGVGFVPVTFDDGTGDSVFYFRIAGEFTYSGIGAGIDLVISEYGPVLAKATVPLAIPLAQTTLLLTGVKGGIQFGGAGFVPPGDPADLLTDPTYDLDFPITLGADGTIAEAVGGCAERNRGYDWADLLVVGPPPCFTWNDGGTITLGGTLTSYAAPGLISGDVTLAADLRFDADGGLPKLRFAGNGNINVFGFPVGTAGFLLALDDPLAPVFDLAILAPAPGSPLGFVMPAQGQLTLRIDTEGIALGTLLGLQTFLERLAEGSLGIAQDMFADALDELAAELEANRHLLLARLLLDLDGDGELSEAEQKRVIDTQFLLDRLLGTNPTIPGLLPTEIPTDVDRLRDLLATTTEITAALQQALFGQLAEVADSYTADLAELFASGVDPLTAAILATQSAVDELTSPMTEERAQALAAYGQVFQEVVLDALGDATSTFFDVFDPTFALEGDLQPVILGMPLGEPVGGASLIVNREGVELGLTVSPTTLYMYAVLVAIGAGTFAPALAGLNDMLGISDRITVRAQLPFTGIIDALVAEGPLAIDPFDAEWNVTLDAELTVAGLTIGRLTGLLVSPRNDTVLDNRIWRTYDPDSVFTPTKIPVRSEEHYEAIRRHGGLLLTADLDAPSLLVDPAATLAELDLELPENLLEYPDWVQRNVQTLRTLEDVGDVQLFLPSLDNLINPNMDAGVWTVDYVDDAGRFDFALTGEQLAEAVMEILDDAYLDGSWNAKLLGVEIGNGRISATTSGYEVEGSLPFLDEPVTIQLGGSAVTVGGEETLMPSALLDVDFDADNITAFADSIGLPDLLGASPSASGRLRLATPGYDARSEDALLVRGGIEATAELSLAPFVDNAEFEITVFPPPGVDPFQGDVLPDFVARASVSELLPLAGITIRQASVEVRRVDGVTSVHIDGEADVAGGTVTVSAQLASDLTGIIDLSTGDGPLTVGGFTIIADSRLELSRRAATFPLLVEFRSDLVVTLPPWLSELIGTTQVEAEGGVASDGSFDLQLVVDELTIPGTGLMIVGATAGQDPTLRFARSGATAELEIAGRLSGATGLPLLVVDGKLSTTGDGSLDVSFPGGGLTLAPFAITGGASIERQGSTWSVDVAGTISLGAVLTNAAVSGSIDQNGIQQLTVGVTSFVAGPLSISNADVRLERVGTAYQLDMSGRATIPQVGSNLLFTGQIQPNGDVRVSLDAATRLFRGIVYSNATFTFDRTAATDTTTMTLTGSATLAGNAVTVDGSLTRVGTAWTGELGITAPTFSLGGAAVGGTLTLQFLTNQVRISIDGTMSIPGLVTDTTATGTVSTGGFGELTLAVTQLRPGGTNSPFLFSGTFRFQRTSGFAGVTRFTSSNASLTWEGGGTTFSLPSFSIATNGAMSVTTSARSVTKGQIQLQLPSASFTTGANASNPTLSIGQSSISVTGVLGPLTVQSFSVGTTGSLSAPFTTKNVPIMGLQLNGTVRLEKSGSTWSLRIDGPTATTLPTVTVPGLGSITLDEFVISSNSTFNVTATSRRVGNDAFAIRNATIRFRKLQQSSSVTVSVDSGAELVVARLQPIPLPTLTFSDQGAISQTMSRVLDFGPMLRRTTSPSAVPLVLENTSNGLQLRLTSARTFRLLNTNLTLQSFTARTDGHFSGTLNGALTLPIGSPSITLASGTFNLGTSTRDGVPITRLTIPASSPLSVGVFRTGSSAPTGPASATVHGWVDSTGRFRFELNASIDLTASLGIYTIGAAGSVTALLRNTGLREAEFSGTICYIVDCRTVTREVRRSDGTMPTFSFDTTLCNPFTNQCETTTTNLPRFPVFRAIPAGIDLAAPQLGPVADIDVTAPAGATSMFVAVPLPSATDDRDPSPVVTCDRSSGQFAIGVHLVTCTAKDNTNKTSAPRSFTITVRAAGEPGFTGMLLITESQTLDTGDSSAATPTVEQGETMTMSADGYATGSAFKGTMYSDPVDLGRGTVNADGVARLTFTVPEVPPGPHTIVIEGRAPDGSTRIVAATVVVAGTPTGFPDAPATVFEPIDSIRLPAPSGGGTSPPALDPDPVAELPATGTSGIPATMSLAVLVLLLGAVLRSSGGHRRRTRLPSSLHGGEPDQQRDRDRRARSAVGHRDHRRGGRDPGADRLGEGPGAALPSRPLR